MALDEGAVLVQVSRELFMRFIAAKPRTLQIYLHKVHSSRRQYRVSVPISASSLEDKCINTIPRE